MKPLRITLLLFALALSRIGFADDLLPSWKDTASKAAIVKFVNRVTMEGSDDFVPPADRIAVFDNDGTLWSEQPMYFQLAFALDRVKALAPRHPEWKNRQPFKAALEGDMKALAETGEHGLLELVIATHAGNTSEEFAQIVRDWVSTARHPKLGRPYTELVFQPMLELLTYLRASGFKTYIVSGGGVEFRPSTKSATASPRSCGCPKSTSSTTRPASRSASTNSSASGRSWPPATPTATFRCWSGPLRRQVRVSV